MDPLQAEKLSILEQQVNNVNWITAFTTNQDVLEEDMKHINSISINTISCDEMALAQRKDTEIEKKRDPLRNKLLMNHAIPVPPS